VKVPIKSPAQLLLWQDALDLLSIPGGFGGLVPQDVVDTGGSRPLTSGNAGGQVPAIVRPSDSILEELVRRYIPGTRIRPLSQKTIPRLAKDPGTVRSIEQALRQVPTHHHLVHGDSSNLRMIEDGSVDLVVTSPPYFNLKRYPVNDRQLGAIENYDLFVKQLDDVWLECRRVLVPGGRLIIVVGDVCRSRKSFGAHMVIPLHASIAEHCRQLDFHNLATVVWHKISNARFEVQNGTAFLGKPYEPNAVIKNDLEYLLMLRKPGGYRRPTEAMRLLSLIGAKKHRAWFNQIVTVRGASTRNHPAPYPVELVEPLIRMFSFVGDTVLDPFLGTGTTAVAAARCGRNSVGVELERSYHKMAVERLVKEAATGLHSTVESIASLGP
jgi:modification methylase